MSNQPNDQDRLFKRYTESNVQQIGDWMHGWGGIAVAVLFAVVIVWMFLQPVVTWVLDQF